MPTGHFTIGDLSFSFDGDLKELAHCREIVREIERAEQRLRRASGSQEVFLIYDQDLEGERGTFDKMRLRTYDDANNYTLDIGVTDNNPLGIYVAYDQNIEAYNRDSGEAWQIDPEGNRVESTAQDEAGEPDTAATQTSEASRQQSRPAEPASEESAPSSRSQTEGPSPADIESAAEVLQKRASRHPPEQRVGETSIPDGPLGEKLKGFAKYCGRSEGYLHRVLDTKGVSSVGKLTVGQVADAVEMIKDEEVLRQNESFESDDELPF
jgi:hypothetical protein